MKKLSILLFSIVCVFKLTAQTPQYYIDNSLTFNSSTNTKISYPFTGGFIAPQFSNIDLNGDGEKDLFVFDRAGNRVLTFLKINGSATNWVYAPAYERAFPKLYSWALLVDYNSDGKEDIFTSSNPFNKGLSVAVYKNISTANVPMFQLVADPLTTDQNITGLPEAPIYCITDDIPAITDVDGDGDIDILTFDASAASITLYGNEAKEKGYLPDSLTFRTYDECWGAFRESISDRTITLGVPCFGGRYYKSGSQHAGSTMLLLDMDDDGDKDLILGDQSYSKLSVLYSGKRDFTLKYDSMIAYDTVFPKINPVNISSFPAAFFLDANIGSPAKDLIVAPNLTVGGKNTSQIWLYKNNGTNKKPDFIIERTNFLQELTIDLGSGVTPRFIDVDNDNDLDLILAHRGDFSETRNSADRLTLFENTGNSTNAKFLLSVSKDYLNLAKDSIRDAKPTFGDLNGDGKLDMLIGDAEGELHYYENNGGTSLSFSPAIKNYMSIDIGRAATPQIIDLDKDSILDLVIGKLNGTIAFFKNTGTKTNPQFSQTPTIDTLGRINVAETYYTYTLNDTGVVEDSTLTYSLSGFAAPYFSDLNVDGELDLVVGSESGKIWLYNSITNLNDSFVESPNFVYSNISNSFTPIDLGYRTIPSAPILSDSAKARPTLMIGNYRGGITFLNTRANTNSIPKVSFKELAVTVFPNPTNGQLNISRSLQQYDGDLIVRINDVLGREVYYGNIQKGVSDFNLNLSNQLSGIYYITLTDNAKYRTVQRVSLIK